MTVTEHPSRDRSSRYSLDALLREYGFKIHSRREGCPPIWKYEGEVYTQEQALSHLDPDDIWYAQYEETAEREALSEMDY